MVESKARCVQNMKHIISNHNKTVLESTKVKESQGKTCNCRDKQSCPLKGQCLQRGVVYKATVEQKPSKTQDTYIGITENELKTRYNQHTLSFRLHHKKSATTLSEFIWKLKESKTEYHSSWAVIERAQPYSAATNRCNLCIVEKYLFYTQNQASTKEGKHFHRAPTGRNIYYKTISGLETKINNNTGSERQAQMNKPQSYPKRAEDRRQLYPPLETPV